MSLANDLSELIYTLDNKYNFKKILFINTITTGHILDTIFLDERTTRFKYTQNNFDDFLETITNINEKFDLICVDPYHEYKESILTINNAISLLNENGILISHDCAPPTYNLASITHIPGSWCGVTYAAFIEFAYNNPDLYYAVINNDFGLGIISKKQIEFVKKITNNDYQKNFLDIFREKKYKEAFYYFKINSKFIINLINE